jgi:hypothetical protein
MEGSEAAEAADSAAGEPGEIGDIKTQSRPPDRLYDSIKYSGGFYG